MSIYIRAPYVDSKHNSNKHDKLTEAITKASSIIVDLEDKQRYDTSMVINNDNKAKEWVIRVDFKFYTPSSYEWYYDAKENRARGVKVTNNEQA